MVSLRYRASHAALYGLLLPSLDIAAKTRILAVAACFRATTTGAGGWGLRAAETERHVDYVDLFLDGPVDCLGKHTSVLMSYHLVSLAWLAYGSYNFWLNRAT